MRCKTLTSGQIEVVIQRLAMGIPQSDIAAEFGVSVRTIQRIRAQKKSEVSRTSDANDETTIVDSLLRDYNIIDAKKRQAFRHFSRERQAREIELFEDREEGWTYHISDISEDLRQSSRWWMAIAYPDSCNIDDVMHGLTQCGYDWAISPLHDKDSWDHDSPAIHDETGKMTQAKGALYKAGDRKKPHYHIVITCDHSELWAKANASIRNITHGPYIQRCRSLKNAVAYFVHTNAPNKYQGYDKAEIQYSPNFHVEPSSYEKGLIFAEICKYIHDAEIDSMSDLVQHYSNDPEYLQQMKTGGLLKSLVTENWLRHNPDGRIRLTRIVNEKGEDVSL